MMISYHRYNDDDSGGGGVSRPPILAVCCRSGDRRGRWVGKSPPGGHGGAWMVGAGRTPCEEQLMIGM